MLRPVHGLVVCSLLLGFGAPLAGAQTLSAQSLSPVADACDVLSDTVFRHVVERGLGSGGRIATVSTRDPGLLVCDRATQAVTTGFSKAMQQMNIYLSWKSPEQERGDLCASVDISQCYPDQSPYVPYNYGDAVFIRNVWFSVSKAVEQSGESDDTVTFVQTILSRHLQREMHRNVRQTPQQMYFQ